MLLIGVQCHWCDLFFCICRSCWRGQAYCSDECRIAGKLKKHGEAQRRYRQTLKGKKAHCEAENRRRYRLNKKSQKKMDDASTTVLPVWCMTLILYAWLVVLHARTCFDKTGCCHFCGASGAIVDKFPRRGYGST